MPPNTVKIDRSTRWGNPFKVGSVAEHPLTREKLDVATAEIAVELFAIHVRTAGGAALADAARRELPGKNLACWCKDGDACHGDVLLQLSNPPEEHRQAA